jgi:hypothetical protein
MTTDQIRYRPGQMEKYITTKSFELGNSGQKVLDGMEILFDGTNAELNGSRMVLPTLRGAVRLGWMVLEDQYDPDAGASPNISANIGFRPANDLGQNPLAPPKRISAAVVESDERVVMNRGERTAAAQQQTIQARAQQGRAGAFVARGNAPDVGGSEFGVEVNRILQTPAKSALQVTPNTVGAAISQANQVKIQPGQGITEEQLLAAMTEDEREAHQTAKEARKADVLTRFVGYVPPPAQTTNLAVNNQTQPKRTEPKARTMVASEPRQVARIASAVQPKTVEGVSVGVTTGGGTEIFDASGSDGVPQQSVVQAEGMTFRNTNGPKKAFPGVTPATPVAQPQRAAQEEDYPEEQPSHIERDGTADARRMTAKMICSEFPDEYDFNDHWKRRLALIRFKYEKNYGVIRAIFASESDDFKRLLLEEFPEAFQS